MNLAVRDGHDVVYVEKLVSRGVRVPHSRTGGRLPLHCTALGKSILAFSPPELIEEVIAAGLRQLTPRTITEPGRLHKDLAAVRERRVAYDAEESRLGMYCAGAPLFNRSGDVVAAISVTGMDGAATARRVAPALLAAALSLTRLINE